MQANVLLVDLGNSRCKSRRLQQAPTGQYSWGRLTLSDDPFSLIDSIADVSEIYIASVRDAAFNHKLQLHCQQQNIAFHLIQTEKQAFGLVNSYQVVSKMGVDRWLAMLGAQILVESDFLVIDAGTAITCDAVFEQHHIGGWIAPGYTLLRKAVTANTARVSEADIEDASINWGQDTEACLHFGCIAQLHGLVQQASALMQNHTSEFQTVISGGDADLLKSASSSGLKKPPRFIDNIVMFGLLRFALKDLPFSQIKFVAHALSKSLD